MSAGSGSGRSGTRLTVALCLGLMALIKVGVTQVVVAGDVGQKRDHNRQEEVAKLVARFETSDAVSALAFSTDGQSLALTTFKVPTTSGVELWSWSAPAHRVRIFASPQRPGAWTNPTALTFSSDGQFLALIHDFDITQPGQLWSLTSVISVWNSQSGQLLKEIRDPTAGSTVPSLQFSPDGQSLLCLYERGSEGPGNQLVLYRTSDWQPQWGVRASAFHPERLSLSPDGRAVAIGGLVAAPGVPMHAPIRIIDTNSHAVLREINAFPAESNVGGLAWSPKGNHIAAGASVYNVYPGVNTIKVFDAQTGKQLAGAPASNQDITSLAYVGSGKYLAETGIRGPVTIWAADLKKVVQELPASAGPLAVSSNGGYLAVASESTVSVWEFR